jgi:hypothetical protein
MKAVRADSPFSRTAMRTLLLCCLLITSAVARGSGVHWLHLQGDKDTVRLLWLPPHWPADLRGFNVKRRTAGGDWQSLNVRPILPTFTREDMETRTNSPTRREDLLQLQEAIADHEIPNVFPLEEEIRLLTGREHFGVKMKGVRSSYRKALLFGFAYEDTNVPQADTYEYALFMVRHDTEQTEPLAVRSWQWGTVPALVLPFGNPVLEPAPGERHMRVVWPIPPALFEQHMVRRLKVYYEDAEGKRTLWSRETPSEQPRRDVTQIDLRRLFEPGVLSVYVRPVDNFDFEGAPSPAVSYEWAKYQDSFVTPSPATR